MQESENTVTPQETAMVTGDSALTPPAAPPRPPADSRRDRRKRDVTCLVCGKRYRSLRADHLRDHGLTRERYRRIYGARAVDAPDGRINGSISSTDPHQTLVSLLADRVASSTEFLDALASECSDHILSAAPLRAQVAFAAAQVIQGRVAIHANATARLSALSAELGEDWRLTAGGHAGRPTPTKDLVSMAMQAHAEIVKAEEMVFKAARLALDERRAAQDAEIAPGFTYSGAAEGIAIPKDLGAADREALRALMGNLTKHVAATREVRQAITVSAEASPSVPAQSGSIVPGSSPVVRQEFAEGSPVDPLAVTTEPRPRPRRRRRA